MTFPLHSWKFPANKIILTVFSVQSASFRKRKKLPVCSAIFLLRVCPFFECASACLTKTFWRVRGCTRIESTKINDEQPWKSWTFSERKCGRPTTADAPGVKSEQHGNHDGLSTGSWITLGLFSAFYWWDPEQISLKVLSNRILFIFQGSFSFLSEDFCLPFNICPHRAEVLSTFLFSSQKVTFMRSVLLCWSLKIWKPFFGSSKETAHTNSNMIPPSSRTRKFDCMEERKVLRAGSLKPRSTSDGQSLLKKKAAFSPF